MSIWNSLPVIDTRTKLLLKNLTSGLLRESPSQFCYRPNKRKPLEQKYGYKLSREQYKCLNNVEHKGVDICCNFVDINQLMMGDEDVLFGPSRWRGVCRGMYCLPPLDDEVFVEGLEATVHLLLPVPGTLEQLRTRFFYIINISQLSLWGIIIE